MRRRDAIRSLSAVAAGLAGAGCLGSPGAESESGGSTPPRQQSTPAERTVSPGPCSTVETEFELPELSKPAELDGAAAAHAAEQVERAYLDAVGFEARDIDEVPRDADGAEYSVGFSYASEVDAGYRVPVRVRFSFSYDGAETTESELDASGKTEVATYEVTTRLIVRVEGYGDLTGTLVCW